MGTDYRQPLTDSQLRALFGQPCVDRGFGTFDVPVLGQVRCQPLVGPQLQRIFAALAHDGLAGEVHTFDGLYNPRPMRGGTGYSHHAWGVALDLNACERADGTTGGSINFGQRGEFPHLRRLLPYFVAEGWAAGLQWRRVPDPMHFEAGSAHGTGLLARGTLRGTDLTCLPGLTDDDLGYLRRYPEYAWAFAPVAHELVLPGGARVPYTLTDSQRASVLVADVAQALGWRVDTTNWPTITCE